MLHITLGMGLALFLLILCGVSVQSFHSDASDVHLSIPPQNGEEDS
jgi:hypothetical protein